MAVGALTPLATTVAVVGNEDVMSILDILPI